jgi:hypothetical protein
MRLLLLLLAVGACKEEASQEVPDAGPAPRAFGARDLGVFVTLPTGWAEDSVDEGSSGAQNGTPSVMTKEVRTVARAHRVSTGKTFLVPPKLVVTVEPTARKNPQEVFEQTLVDLKKLDGAADVGVVRSAMSSRFVGREQVGEIEIAYFVRAGGAAKEVIHRSLLVLRRPPEGSRAIVTVTATYLAQDQETVSAELQSIMSSLRLEGAMAVE